MTLTDQALDLVFEGVPVFPCAENKRPCTEHGFLDASTDPALVARMFANPLARHVGVPTGSASGIDVLDLDPAGADWFREHGHVLPETRTHRTRRGFHRLYKHREGVRCNANVIAPGVDVRGDGGYIIFWPASGLEVFRDIPIAEWSDDAFALVTAPSRTVSGLKEPAAPEELAPPSAEAMLALLRDMPNPAEVGHSEYVSVCLAIQGALRGGLALETLTEEQAEAIRDAAAEWAARWEGPTPSDYERERAKWEHDWSNRDNDVSGWRNLVGHAGQFGMPIAGLMLEIAQAEFGELPDEPEMDLRATARLAALLSEDSWRDMDIPPQDRLLGDLLTTTTRAFLSGRTGLGKTLFGMGIAYGVASGAGFLRWESARPAKVLYIDGEMPAELIKPRAIAEARRLAARGFSVPTGNLMVFGRDIETQARKLVPDLPTMAPLNTEEGRRWLFALLKAVGKPDLLIFDNVMSLVVGDQKDEVPWSETLPLVQAISDRRMGQLWLDHTGHNSDRQYGSSTKAWRFDLSAVISPPAGAKADPRQVSFTLKFDKARRRTPDNFQQFEDQTIRLADDAWTAESVVPTNAKAEGPKVSPQAEACFDVLFGLALIDGTVSRGSWQAACLACGAVPAEASFRTHLSNLKVAGWIAVDGNDVQPLRWPDADGAP